MPYDITYSSDNAPIPYVFTPGVYKIELWGAQGGNITDSIIGGKGGYAKGILHIRTTKTFYFYIGEKGKAPTNAGFTESSFNGGGNGNGNQAAYLSAGGGGATDLRTNYTLETRILVAGGGSGATSYSSSNLNGSCGGGPKGEDGRDSIYDTRFKKGEGGSQVSGGGSLRQNGIFGFGGNQTVGSKYGSGGGGGGYGGGCGEAFGATGGGGSGYSSLMMEKTVLLSGCSLIPSFFNYGYIQGHDGDGAARITKLNEELCTSLNDSHINYSIFLPFII